MLVNSTKTQNFNAVSAIDVSDGTGQPVAVFGASINQAGVVTFNQQIQNMVLYQKNKEVTDADFEEFREIVLASV